MNKDLITYTLKKFITLKSLIHFLINSILILLILICLTSIKLISDFYNSTINGVSGRTMLVSNDTDLELLNSNEHIIFANYDKYRTGYNFFYNNGNYIYIKPLIDQKTINIVDGTSLSKSKDIICPKILYPFEYSLNMNFKKTIDSKTILNNKITDGKYQFTIVGTYSNIQMQEANICYISIDDFENFDIEPYQQIMILYDNLNNKEEVINFLNSNNIAYMKTITFDESYKYIYTISFYIMLIVIIITINITYNFFKKSINNNNKTIGLLRAYGEQDKKITNYYLIAQISLASISIIFALVFYKITYVIIYPYLSEFMFYNLYPKIPITYFVAFLIIFYLYMFISIKYQLNKKLKSEIYELLEK